MLKLLAKPVVEQIQLSVASRVHEVSKLLGRPPMLAVVLVGGDPASVIYTSKKGEAALKVGMRHETISLPQTSTPHEVHEVIRRLNLDPSVDGILIQRPLPPGFNEEEVLYWVDPAKDVDAFHPETTGRMILGLKGFQPCTPAGVMRLLQHYQINPAGKVACVIGRSSIVGKPMAALLLQADATVLQCHSKTHQMASLTQLADILVVAAGRPQLIDERHVKKGAVVIDVGIHRDAHQKIVGDVNFERVSTIASAITPVPGGVGPMTISVLLENTVLAAELKVST